MRRSRIEIPVRGTVDAALARTAAAHLLDAAGVADEAGLGFLDAVTDRVLAEAGSGAAKLVVEPDAAGTVVRATVRDGSGADRWIGELELPAPVDPDALALHRPDVDTRTLAEELLRVSSRAGRMASLAAERARELKWHQTELEETNQGVLALHAELAQAGDEQRRALAAARAARDEAETARSRLTFLSAASAHLMATLDQRELFALVRELMVPDFADGVRVWALLEGGGLGRADGAADGDDTPPSAVRAAVAASGPVHGDGRSCLPLVSGSSVLGVLELYRPRALGDDELLLTELARRIAVAVDNARRFEHERDVAATLQRAMLTRLPRTPGMELTARYLPAARGMNVGGDWYDVFPLGNGEFIGVVGDVTGHGIQAAVMMGQLRTALRAYALEEHRPAALLARLHRLLGHLEPDLFATAVIVRFRPGHPEVTLAGAGHPPPLWRDADGTVRTVDLLPGGMLGLPIDPAHTDTTVSLPPGAALLLYSDGLVERRGESIDDGIGRLVKCFSGLPAGEGGPDAAADGLLDAMITQQDSDDDVCLLVFVASEGPAGDGPGHR
ncbi:Stage II sporulation protein E (SpoIIE) [Nocardiopsis flavescens]|uniref:Stage II sporulation protein E (SpoIIE) n=1 Tax=Nocardiopsis flavescens TaxID=758803 RepID=A0A1M6FR26_9ACTN|nr:SpoIIE family protein phosphatase [Nocardiopsis flavescens]SHJ00125.1 Stage II sporulation protein E (SpoIIE) [Nocardiopsis flavescens]